MQARTRGGQTNPLPEPDLTRRESDTQRGYGTPEPGSEPDPEPRSRPGPAPATRREPAPAAPPQKRPAKP